jgi:hypothetical protein
MSTPAKENRDLVSRGSHDHQINEEATMGALTTSLGAVAMLLAFTCSHGTEQLLLASLGALLAGGVR